MGTSMMDLPRDLGELQQQDGPLCSPLPWPLFTECQLLRAYLYVRQLMYFIEFSPLSNPERQAVFLLALASVVLCLEVFNGNKNTTIGKKVLKTIIAIVSSEIRNHLDASDRNMENINWKSCFNFGIGKILRWPFQLPCSNIHPPHRSPSPRMWVEPVTCF